MSEQATAELVEQVRSRYAEAARAVQNQQAERIAGAVLLRDCRGRRGGCGWHIGVL